MMHMFSMMLGKEHCYLCLVCFYFFCFLFSKSAHAGALLWFSLPFSEYQDFFSHFWDKKNMCILLIKFMKIIAKSSHENGF